ncbi:MAG: glycosyltransferase [Anaerolineales bacterium]|nr:glycosyltransferase [Anaerolineales bacterium]
MNDQVKKPHVLFLFSDTGGGHRSATNAIIEALELELGDTVTTEMVDFFKDYAPLPWNYAPELYPEIVKVPELWGFGFKVSDGRKRARALTASAWPYVRRNFKHLINSHPCDLMVSVHSLSNSLILKAMGRRRIPFITVVTDMVTSHALWFDQRADLILVPTEMAAERALAYEMRPEQIRVVGQPVAERYCVPFGNKNELRKALGWPQDKFIALLVGGGDGMGPLGETAHAIAESGLDVSMAIVAGRNKKLKAELEAKEWPHETFVYGFTNDMPDFMRAADVLITKAGPGTISEAFNAGLPIILYSRLPGQEDGNIVYVVRKQAGAWAPKPELVVETLRTWINYPKERERIVDACRRAARPDASRKIARIIGAKVGVLEDREKILEAEIT